MIEINKKNDCAKEQYSSEDKKLLAVPNLGKAMLKLLKDAGISNIELLKQQDPKELYLKIIASQKELQSCKIYDMCTAVIHSAKTGSKMSWVAWGKIRNKKFIRGVLKNILEGLSPYDKEICNASALIQKLESATDSESIE